MEGSVFRNQVLTLSEGKTLTISGVRDIIGFSDGEITLDGEGGKITVEGEELKIESLSKEGGNILITGEITGIFRSAEIKKKRGFFG